jgi:transcriptional regulator GlxA family with amidase domain
MAESVGYRALTPSLDGSTMATMTHQVAIVVFPGVQSLDVAGPHEVFSGATQLGADYSVRLVSPHSGAVRSESGLQLLPDGPLPAPESVDTLIVPGGSGIHAAAADPRLAGWVAATAAVVPRLASVCSGAFMLAKIGVLDGKPATTHWARAERLAAQYPEVDVQPDPIFIRTGKVWTSAGVTAGMDLALAMVEDDHGGEIAQTVARWLVMYMRRPGGQSQFATPVWSPPAQRPAVRAAQDLIHAQPEADLRVPVLAELVGMSPRHFSREFTRQVGMTPGQYVEQVRLETARRLLESEPVTVPVAARRSGFGSAETMRQAFVRRLGIPPDDYRRRFALPVS